MIGANIGKFLNDVAIVLWRRKKTIGYRGYFQPVLQRRYPYCTGTEKRCRCGKSDQYAVQKDTSGGYFWRQYACGCRRKTGDVGTAPDHRTSHVNFQFELVNTRKVYRRCSTKEEEKREIQEGLIKACDVIDLIIEILRGSRRPETGKGLPDQWQYRRDYLQVKSQRKESHGALFY